MIVLSLKKILKFILISFFLASCGANKKYQIPNNLLLKNETKEQIKLKTSKIPNLEEKDFLFEKLPDKEKLRLITKIGKNDPFIKTSTGDINQSIKMIKLKGVYKFDNNNFALIQYGDLSGEVKAGYKGGGLNNLLPRDVIVEKIDILGKEIILKSNKKRFKVNMIKKELFTLN